MYKRTLEAIASNPPKQTSMCKAQFGNAKYLSDFAFCVPVEIDSTGAYCVIIYEEY